MARLGNKPGLLSVMALTIAWCLLRFLWLETSPGGFFADEASAAVNVMCLGDLGESLEGRPWPLFASGAGGGFHRPAYIYFALAWTSVFGESITAFRSVAALFSVFTIVGLFFLARLLGGRECAWLCALVGALSPWSFQFARIAWDPALMPCFTVWGLYFLLRPGRWHHGIWAGFSLALAMYSYQAALVTTVLWLGSFLLIPRLHVRATTARLMATFGALTTASIPLALFTLSPTGRARFDHVSLFAPSYWSQELQESYWNLGVNFLKNMRAHFGFDYLFTSGDWNVRHSPPFVGQLSYLDILAVAFVLGYGAWLLARSPRTSRPAELRWPRQPALLYLIAIAGILIGTVPAALTWDTLPHSLRSLAAWPFFSLASGAILYSFYRTYRWAALVVLTVALTYSGFFIPRYFGEYPKLADWWFDGHVQRLAKEARTTGSWQEFYQELHPYGPGSPLYYVMRYRGHDCQQARTR